jgi:hypothetical protein
LKPPNRRDEQTSQIGRKRFSLPLDAVPTSLHSAPQHGETDFRRRLHGESLIYLNFGRFESIHASVFVSANADSIFFAIKLRSQRNRQQGVTRV